MADPEKQVFSTSRVQAALGPLGSLALSGVGWLMLQDDPSGSVPWACTAFFALCAAVFAIAGARSLRLSLDQEGFALIGGLRSSPLKVD